MRGLSDRLWTLRGSLFSLLSNLCKGLRLFFLPADNVFAGIFEGDLVSCLEIGQGFLLVPVEALLTGTMLIRLAEEDQAAAGDAIDHGGFGFRFLEFEGSGMGPAVQGGSQQLPVTMKRKTEQVDTENGKGAEKKDGDHGEPHDAVEDGNDDKGKKKGQDDADDGIALFQLGADLLNVFFGIQFGHCESLSGEYDEE